MNYFLAWVALWAIWLNSLLVLKEESWWLLALLLGWAIIMPRSLFWPWKWKKAFFALFSLLAIVGHGQLLVTPAWKEPKIVAHQNLIEAQVVKITGSFYQILTKEDQTLYLSKKFYQKGKVKKLELEIEDQITFCAQKSQTLPNNEGLWPDKRKKTVVRINNYNKKECQIKIKSATSWRSKLKQHLTQIHPPFNQKWINFLLFQEWKEELLPWRTKMLNTGIYHLFIISGWHLLLVSKIWFSISKRRKKQYAKYGWELGGLLTCWLLVYLTNWKLTTLKSGLLITGMWIAKKSGFHSLSWQEQLTIWGLIFLTVKPLIFLQLDFQFSFLASWILLKKKEQQRIGFWKRNYQKLVKHYQILFILLPLLIFINSEINLLSGFHLFFFAGWLTLIYPLFLLTIWIPPLSSFWTIIWQGQEKLLLVSQDHLLLITFGKWDHFWITIYYFVFTLSQKLESKQSNKLLLILLMSAAISLITWINWQQPHYFLHFINVRHGLSIFLQGPNKKLNILFDAGIGKKQESNSPIITHFLKRQAVTKLDALFLSHQDSDHRNNLSYLQTRFKITKIYSNQNPAPFYQIQNLKIFNLNQWGQKANKENNRSLVLQMKINRHSILLMFDLEKEQEKILLKEKLFTKNTIFQVGHHGSKDATSLALLKKVQPKFCVISSAIARKLTEAKLRKHNCQIFNTAYHHHISFQLSKKIVVQTTVP